MGLLVGLRLASLKANLVLSILVGLELLASSSVERDFVVEPDTLSVEAIQAFDKCDFDLHWCQVNIHKTVR